MSENGMTWAGTGRRPRWRQLLARYGYSAAVIAIAMVIGLVLGRA